jgi:cytochrome c556
MNRKNLVVTGALVTIVGIVGILTLVSDPFPKVIQKDLITVAQEKITEAGTKLKEEEARLTTEMDTENARHDTQVKRIEAEFERIRLVRLSFTSAPAQPE